MKPVQSPLAVPGATRNVSARKTAENHLAQMEGKYRGLLEAAPDAMVVVNENGEIVLLNVKAEKQFGYHRDELIGQKVTNIIPKGFAERLVADGLRTAAEALAQQIGTGIELIGRRKDRSEFPMELMLSPHQSAEGILVTAAIRDITTRKSAEAQLRQAQKMEVIGQLTGGMAHDFNNLLGIIIGNLDILRDLRKDDKEADELTRDALEAALRGADLTHRLLAFARQQPLRPQSVDVNELISAITRLMSRTLGENIVINFNQKPDIWPVVVDSAQLESCIVNLATNARDAMPKGGKLLIATTNQTLDADYVAWQQDLAAGDYVRIEVSDTGMGMSPQVKERIFEPFYTTKEQGKGTGLGLSMVFGFIKQSGGHISVYSEPDIGTTFRLYLPRATDVSAAAAEPAATEALLPGTGETVLVVEDNDALRHVVLRQIKDFGYRVLEADGATAALVILESEKVDLIFTDIVMPGDIDGITLAQRAVIRQPNLKIVLTSGFPDPRIISGFGAIASSVLLLSKPYRKDKLAAVLRQALDQ